jgi:hypothetical protein
LAEKDKRAVEDIGREARRRIALKIETYSVW